MEGQRGRGRGGVVQEERAEKEKTREMNAQERKGGKWAGGKAFAGPCC